MKINITKHHYIEDPREGFTLYLVFNTGSNVRVLVSVKDIDEVCTFVNSNLGNSLQPYKGYFGNCSSQILIGWRLPYYTSDEGDKFQTEVLDED